MIKDVENNITIILFKHSWEACDAITTMLAETRKTIMIYQTDKEKF